MFGPFNLGISPSAEVKRWNDFVVARDLRNVLVHRLAVWQPGLDPKPSLHARIAAVAAHPDAYRGRVPLSDSDLTDAVDLAKEIASTLDPLT